MRLHPIGILHTPFQTPEGMPIQPCGAEAIEGVAEIAPEYAEGLADLDGFSHIILLYGFHRATGVRLRVTPFLDGTSRGVFATRAPVRPNHIGLSIVRLTRVENNRLLFTGADMLDGTPLYDIKPWVPEFRAGGRVKRGWLEEQAQRGVTALSDERFV